MRQASLVADAKNAKTKKEWGKMTLICNVCGHSVEQPYRRRNYTTKEIIEGCVDKCHDEYLISGTASHKWAMDAEKSFKIGRTNTKPRQAYYY
jgi:DNA replicative helicase MCM subunit Mcm2 (Cdc46/Mcm family)